MRSSPHARGCSLADQPGRRCPRLRAGLFPTRRACTARPRACPRALGCSRAGLAGRAGAQLVPAWGCSGDEGLTMNTQVLVPVHGRCSAAVNSVGRRGALVSARGRFLTIRELRKFAGARSRRRGLFSTARAGRRAEPLVLAYARLFPGPGWSSARAMHLTPPRSSGVLRLARGIQIGCYPSLVLRTHNLDKLPRPRRTNPKLYAERVRRDRLLMSSAIRRVLLPRLFQQIIRYALVRHPSMPLRQMVRHSIVRLNWIISAVQRDPDCRNCVLGARRFCIPGLSTDSADRLQEGRADLSPTDQKQRPDGVECRLAELALDQRVRYVQCQGHDAGEDQQAASWTKYLDGCSGQCKVPDTQQQPQDRQVNRWRDERCDPDRHAKTESEAEDVAEPEEERQTNDGSP